jgi:hypothetical protein
MKPVTSLRATAHEQEDQQGSDQRNQEGTKASEPAGEKRKHGVLLKHFLLQFLSDDASYVADLIWLSERASDPSTGSG